MAIAWLTGNQLENGTTDLNAASSATALQYNLDQYFDKDYFSFDEAEPTKLVFTQPGDYIISAGLPMTSNHVNTGSRNDITQELRLNGTLIPGGYSDSSYIRNISNHFESSNRSTTVVLGAQPGDCVEHYVWRGSTETSNTVTDDGHGLYVEYIEHKTAFVARATQTTDSTNLNQAAAFALEWSIEDRVDKGFTHDAGSPEEIVFKKPGRYSLYCNVPLSTTTQRGNVTARILLDGVQIDGGQFQQGMVRNANGIDTGSCHYAGLVSVEHPGQVLTVTVEQEGPSGTVTVGDYYANIIIKKTWSDMALYNTSAATVGGSGNWNPTSKTTIDWATDVLIDNDFFGHSMSSNSDQITIKKDGDYFALFNVAFGGTVQRAAPKSTLQVNGNDVVGIQSKSGYVRDSGGADASSDVMVGFMPGLKAGDIITVSMQAAGATGTINQQTLATLMLRGKNLPVAQVYWFG